MKKITAIIERASDGGYSVFTENEMFSGMGETVEEAKTDMTGQIDFYLSFCKEENRPYPAFLDSEYEITYQYDTESLLQYYAGIITPTALSRLAGINAKQIRAYAKGKTKPRPETVKKIENGLHKLAEELSGISLS